MPQIRAHRRGQREVLGGCSVIPCSGQGQAKTELGVVVAGAGVHYPAEAAGRRLVPAGVKLCPAQGLQDAARFGLRGRGALEQLRGRCRAAPAEQIESAPVKGICVLVPGFRPLGRATLFAGTGILAACRSF
jgi:hypothetical protein